MCRSTRRTLGAVVGYDDEDSRARRSLEVQPQPQETLPEHDAALRKPQEPATESRLEWDEATQLWWSPTEVDPYDLPDGRAWHREFLEVQTRVTLEASGLFSEPVRPARGATGSSFSAASVSTASSTPNVSPPATPTRPANPWANVALTRTPPRKWSGASSSSSSGGGSHVSVSELRAARLAHTKALKEMTRRPGVVEVVQGRELAFFRFGGQIFAVDAKCPHQGASLVEGEVGDIEDAGDASHQCYITCPVHKMKFDLASGKTLEGSCQPLRTYRAQVRLAEDGGHQVARVYVGFEGLDASYFDPSCSNF